MRDLTTHLKGELTSPPPAAAESRLARLLRSGALASRCPDSEQKLSSSHKQLQRLAVEMIRVREERDLHAALIHLPELESTRDQLLSCLQALMVAPGARFA